MSTEHLTPEEHFLNNQRIVRVDISMIDVKYNYSQVCQLLRLYSASLVERQTKQLRKQRDKSKQLLERWLNVRERQMKGDPTMLSMESIQIETRDFLKHLNQDNEG